MKTTDKVILAAFLLLLIVYPTSVLYKHYTREAYQKAQKQPLPKYFLRWQTNGEPELRMTNEIPTVSQPHDPRWGFQYDDTHKFKPTEVLFGRLEWSTSYTKPPVLILTNNFIYLQGSWLIRVTDEQWNLITNTYKDKAEVDPPKTTLSFR